MKRALPMVVALLSGFCSLLPAAIPSLAQSFTPYRGETVTIEDKRILEGIWRFAPFARQWRSQWRGTSDFWFDKGSEMYCRIGQAKPEFTFNCLGISLFAGEATLDADGFVRLSALACTHDSCTGKGRWVFRGQLQSKTEISGHNAFVLPSSGGYHENPERITITKVNLLDKTPDRGGQASFLQRLLGEMASGTITEPYDAQSQWVQPSRPDISPIPSGMALQAYRFLPPETLRPLGQIQAVIYVGEFAPSVGFDSKEFFVYSDQPSSIYDVEFENGERLCALHRRPDGILDFFRCI
jgi:hypothetical protein